MGFIADSLITSEQSFDIQAIQLVLETGWTWEYVYSLPLAVVGKLTGYRNGKVKAQQELADG